MPDRVGGNTANCLNMWKKISSDPWVISSIGGIKIPLKQWPVQTSEPRPIPFSQDECAKMDLAVIDLFSKNVIESSFEEDAQFVSNIFMVPKHNGKVRIILDLSRFNDFVYKDHFKMENIHSATNMITHGVFMSSIDRCLLYVSYTV